MFLKLTKITIVDFFWISTILAGVVGLLNKFEVPEKASTTGIAVLVSVLFLLACFRTLRLWNEHQLKFDNQRYLKRLKEEFHRQYGWIPSDRQLIGPLVDQCSL